MGGEHHSIKHSATERSENEVVSHTGVRTKPRCIIKLTTLEQHVPQVSSPYHRYFGHPRTICRRARVERVNCQHRKRTKHTGVPAYRPEPCSHVFNFSCALHLFISGHFNFICAPRNKTSSTVLLVWYSQAKVTVAKRKIVYQFFQNNNLSISLKFSATRSETNQMKSDNIFDY